MNQFFEDAHRDLLFKSWHHRHEFAIEERAGVPGTIVRDVLIYELAFGPLAPAVNRLFCRRSNAPDV
jgi:ligand-binding SRPBCC domain-containing protein